MPCDADRFDTKNPNLCPSLRWKGMFILAERDSSVPATNDGLYWCMHTQTCIGPDGNLAEPSTCSAVGRDCHRGNCK